MNVRIQVQQGTIVVWLLGRVTQSDPGSLRAVPIVALGRYFKDLIFRLERRHVGEKLLGWHDDLRLGQHLERDDLRPVPVASFRSANERPESKEM